MRQHKAKLDPSLHILFKRWQLSRQYFFLGNKKTSEISLIKPMDFDASAQKNDNDWHIPYTFSDSVRLPDLYEPPQHWICLRKLKN